MTGEKLTVGRVTVELSNTAKVLFPGDGITKGDLVEYYQAVAGEMLPLLRDRPVSMTRFPDGLTKAGIVQKNVPAYFPDWITRVRVRKEGGSLRQVVCDKPATIVYLANQACIELHAFLSRLAHIDQPDQLIFDLDPPDGDRFADVRVCALRLRELLAGELGLPAFVKTTGGNGLHVHVPLNARQDFDTVREFARQAAELLAAPEPGPGHHRAAQGQARPADLRGPDAERLCPARRRALLGPCAPRRPGGHTAELGRAGRPGASPRPVHAAHRAAADPRGRPGGRPLGGTGPAAPRARPGAGVPAAAHGVADRPDRRAVSGMGTADRRRDTAMTVLGSQQPSGGDQEVPTGQLVKQLSEQVSQLVREEVKLATLEMTGKAKTAARGAGLFGGSGVVALYGTGCLLAAAIIALAGVMRPWLAALIVGVALFAVAGIAALAGKGQFKKATPPMPSQAAESVKADVEQIKESAHR